jgi:uroporphyrinogen decarboxylase
MSPTDYFGFERRSFGPDTSLLLPSKTLEDTEEYTVVSNSDGAIVKEWKHKTSTPEFRGFLISSRDVWNAHKHLLAGDDSRISWGTLKSNKKCRQEGLFVTLFFSTGYERLQAIVGSENLLMAMATEPEWAADMFMSHAELNVDMCQRMNKGGFEFDAVLIGGDMAYRNGLLFSPRHYKELISPAHRMLCKFFHSRNMPVILHSCGNVKEIIPLLIEDGFDCLQPLEVKAGMNLIELKAEFGDKLAFMGGIDVRKMAAEDPSLIEEEIRSKFAVAKKGGGYIYHSDHSVPDDVSFQQYCHVVELVKKYGQY